MKHYMQVFSRCETAILAAALRPTVRWSYKPYLLPRIDLGNTRQYSRTTRLAFGAARIVWAKMKRKAPPTKAAPPSKKSRPQLPDYHLSPQVKDEGGHAVWPAPKDSLKLARDLIVEW